jgi:hypothetical protein
MSNDDDLILSAECTAPGCDFEQDVHGEGDMLDAIALLSELGWYFSPEAGPGRCRDLCPHHAAMLPGLGGGSPSLRL